MKDKLKQIIEYIKPYDLHICFGPLWGYNVEKGRAWLMERIFESAQGAEYYWLCYLDEEDIKDLAKIGIKEDDYFSRSINER